MAEERREVCQVPVGTGGELALGDRHDSAQDLRAEAFPLVGSQTKSKGNIISARRTSPCGSGRCGGGLTAPVSSPCSSITCIRYWTFTTRGSAAKVAATCAAASERRT